MTYNESWNRPHEPGKAANWQESDCYWFYDAAAGIGGYHRIGQYPGRGTGQILLFAYKAGGQRFRRIEECGPEQCARSATGQSVGSSWVEACGDGAMRYGWAERDSEAELTFYDPFYTPRSWMKDEPASSQAGLVKAKMNTDGHLEVSGRIKGKLRLGAESCEVDALAHRDRSWGARDYRAAHQHRMVSGTSGPALSWATFVLQLDGGHLAKAGFVARDGRTFDVTDIQVLAEFDSDGMTVAGLRSRLFLEDGSTLDVVGPAVQSCMFVAESWLASSHHFVVLDGGFTILDATNRPQKGDYIPTPRELGSICAQDGLTPAAARVVLRKSAI